MQASEYVGIEAVTRPAPAAGILVTSPAEASRVVIPTVTKTLTVRQFVTAAGRPGARTPPDYQSLAAMLALHVWRRRRGADDAVAHAPAWFGPAAGLCAGFTTMVANAAEKISALGLKNVSVRVGTPENVPELFPEDRFDHIYVFLAHSTPSPTCTPWPGC